MSKPVVIQTQDLPAPQKRLIAVAGSNYVFVTSTPVHRGSPYLVTTASTGNVSSHLPTNIQTDILSPSETAAFAQRAIEKLGPLADPDLPTPDLYQAWVLANEKQSVPTPHWVETYISRRRAWANPSILRFDDSGRIINITDDHYITGTMFHQKRDLGKRLTHFTFTGLGLVAVYNISHLAEWDQLPDPEDPNLECRHALNAWPLLADNYALSYRHLFLIEEAQATGASRQHLNHMMLTAPFVAHRS